MRCSHIPTRRIVNTPQLNEEWLSNSGSGTIRGEHECSVRLCMKAHLKPLDWKIDQCQGRRGEGWCRRLDLVWHSELRPLVVFNLAIRSFKEIAIGKSRRDCKGIKIKIHVQKCFQKYIQKINKHSKKCLNRPYVSTFLFSHYFFNHPFFRFPLLFYSFTGLLFFLWYSYDFIHRNTRSQSKKLQLKQKKRWTVFFLK